MIFGKPLPTYRSDHVFLFPVELHPLACIERHNLRLLLQASSPLTLSRPPLSIKFLISLSPLTTPFDSPLLTRWEGRHLLLEGRKKWRFAYKRSKRERAKERRECGRKPCRKTPPKREPKPVIAQQLNSICPTQFCSPKP